MKFFVSWTTREPLFQKYDPDCNVLVSPANAPLYWSISNWETQPNALLIDSGAYSIKNNQIPSCGEILQRQISMTNQWPKSKRLYFSHPDLLIPLKSNFKEKNKIINLSIERAKKYFELHFKTSSNSTPIGVIHGFDEETIVNTYYELKKIGYQSFALGSIGIRLSKNKQLCLNTIDIIQRYNIKPIHLFGITLPINGNNFSKNINSFDSATPAKLAFYGTVLYGSPLKRYVISPTSKQMYHDKCFTFRESLTEPIPCKCPICKINPQKLILEYDPNAKQNRIIHNYFQIKWEIERINSPGHGHSFH